MPLENIRVPTQQAPRFGTPSPLRGAPRPNLGRDLAELGGTLRKANMRTFARVQNAKAQAELSSAVSSASEAFAAFQRTLQEPLADFNEFGNDWERIRPQIYSAARSGITTSDAADRFDQWYEQQSVQQGHQVLLEQQKQTVRWAGASGLQDYESAVRMGDMQRMTATVEWMFGVGAIDSNKARELLTEGGEEIEYNNEWARLQRVHSVSVTTPRGMMTAIDWDSMVESVTSGEYRLAGRLTEENVQRIITKARAERDVANQDRDRDRRELERQSDTSIFDAWIIRNRDGHAAEGALTVEDLAEGGRFAGATDTQKEEYYDLLTTGEEGKSNPVTMAELVRRWYNLEGAWSDQAIEDYIRQGLRTRGMTWRDANTWMNRIGNRDPDGIEKAAVDMITGTYDALIRNLEQQGVQADSARIIGLSTQRQIDLTALTEKLNNGALKTQEEAMAYALSLISQQSAGMFGNRRGTDAERAENEETVRRLLQEGASGDEIAKAINPTFLQETVQLLGLEDEVEKVESFLRGMVGRITGNRDEAVTPPGPATQGERFQQDQQGSYYDTTGQLSNVRWNEIIMQWTGQRSDGRWYAADGRVWNGSAWVGE